MAHQTAVQRGKATAGRKLLMIEDYNLKSVRKRS